jgi:hypothetical protein
MPPSDFRIIVQDDGSDADRRQRLNNLVLHRTNVDLADVSDAGVPIDDVIAGVDSTYVLLLDEGVTVAPTALERLCDLADATGAEICIGKTSRRGERVPDLPTIDEPRIGAEDAAPLAPCGRLYLVSFLRDADLRVGTEGVSELDARALARAEVVVWCADFTSFVLPAQPSRERTARRWVARASSHSWVSGNLEVLVGLSPFGDDPALPPHDVSAAIFRQDDGREWRLSATAVDGEPASQQATQWRLRFDPSKVASGRPLEPGQWQVALLVTDAIGTTRVRMRVSKKKASTASCHAGEVYVAHGGGGFLGLDAGARRHPVGPIIDPQSAAVIEDARGSLLKAHLPSVDLAPDVVLAGELLVGKFPLRAWVTREDGHAVLHSWLSGLAGSYDLALRLSSSAPAPTGARLIIGPRGEMRVEPVARGSVGQPAQTGAPDPESKVRTWAKKVPGAVAIYRPVARRIRRRA